MARSVPFVQMPCSTDKLVMFACESLTKRPSFDEKRGVSPPNCQMLIAHWDDENWAKYEAVWSMRLPYQLNASPSTNLAERCAVS